MGGTRGDVQPYIPLARALRDRGHEAVVTGPSEFEQLAYDAGVGFEPAEIDPKLLVGEQLETGEASPLEFMLRSRQRAGPLMKRYLGYLQETCKNADAVVYSAVGIYGHSVARSMSLPAVGAFLGPLVAPTRDYPVSFLPVPGSQLEECGTVGFGRETGRTRTLTPTGLRRLPIQMIRAYNRLSYGAFQQVYWQILRGPANGALKETERLDPYPFWGPFVGMKRRREPVVFGYSHHILPEPSDWGSELSVSGYWFLEGKSGYEPPEGLTEFIEAGRKPISVGFGSMSGGDPRRLTDLLYSALRSTGERAIILAGWGEIGSVVPEDLRERVYVLDEAPHDWLFPRVAAAIHHGGAGTTAAVLRAGIPAITIPFFGDQFFWGARVAGIGSGTRPITRRSLTPDILASSIKRAVEDDAMRDTASRLGKRIRSEDGAKNAALTIEQRIAEQL